MLGLYIMGLEWTALNVAFALLNAIFLTVAYGFIGAAWIILKTDEALQAKAVAWARGGMWGMVLGMGAVRLASPLVSPRIFDKWFGWPETLVLLPFPVRATLVLVVLWVILRRLPAPGDAYVWVPFAAASVLMAFGFAGMAYSSYPYVVPDRLTIYDAASAPESLMIILVGTLFVLPLIIGYSILAYTVFRGKATQLSYD